MTNNLKENECLKIDLLDTTVYLRLLGLLVIAISLLAVSTQPSAADTFRDCEDCPEMVVVPAGSFIMGSRGDERGRDDNEGPQHRVIISKPFAVGKYELTRGQFAAFIAATGYNVGSLWRNPDFEQNDAHPVVSVSWADVKAYIRWLSSQTGHQYRLLSEAEWEYVARAGTPTLYHFGDTINPSQANHLLRHEGTAEVGLYSANKFGLHDVHGNVWEWVEDCWHDDYEGAPTNGSAWVSGCVDFEWKDVRVVRGGSWSDYSRYLRSAFRLWFDSGLRYNFVGFRVARTLEP